MKIYDGFILSRHENFLKREIFFRYFYLIAGQWLLETWNTSVELWQLKYQPKLYEIS